MRPRGHRLTPEARAELERLLREGATASHAAAVVGCDVSSAARRAARLGLTLGRGRPRDARVSPEAARAAVAEHGNTHRAAAALGCGWHTIARRLETV